MIDVKIKIYRMNDCDHYAGFSLEDCCKAYAENMGEKYETDEQKKSFKELFVDDGSEVSEDLLDIKKVVVDVEIPRNQWKTMTFRDALNEMIEKNPRQFPSLFCSTEH
jgi:hypothetical protein